MFNPKKISPDLGNYLAGLADAEGSFNVSFRFRKDYKIPLKISLCFNFSQKENDQVLVSLFKKELQCGTIRERKHDGVYYYEVNNFNDIQTNVIPFFKKFGFLSAKKKKDFSKFRQIAKLIETKDHLTVEGIQEILKIRKEMNNGGDNRRKYSDRQLLRILRDYMPNT